MYAWTPSIVVCPSSVIVKTFCLINGSIVFCSLFISSVRVPDVPSIDIEIAGLDEEVCGPRTTRSGTDGSVFGGDCINHPTGE